MIGHTDCWFNTADQAALQTALGPEWLLPGMDHVGNSVPAEDWFQPPESLRAARPAWSCMPGSYGAQQPPILLVTKEAEWDRSDPENPVLTSPQEDFGGFTLGLSCHVDIERFEDLPAEIRVQEASLLLVCNRNQERLLPIWQSARLTDEVLETIRVSRAWAGYEYHFRNGVTKSRELHKDRLRRHIA